MSPILAALLFVARLGLVIYFAEKLVEGAIGTSWGFGVCTFLISVLFTGFDPENLMIGAVGSVQGVAGNALGSVIGAAMVAMAIAFGITALLLHSVSVRCRSRSFLYPIWRCFFYGCLD